MQSLTAENVCEFLCRFENVDGGIVERINVDFKIRHTELWLIGFDTRRKAGNDEGWRVLRLQMAGCREFCFQKGVNESGVQLDDHLEIVWIEGAVYLVLDPLQARDYKQAGWTVDQVRRSRWYVGGQSLSWELCNREHG